jgi:sterol desaturase/sphingolipid hydroxylase (fatty acid hydroxylase superfamily)
MWAGIAGSFAIGLGITPLLEYLWHAHLAHGRRADPSRDVHLKHHREAYTVPPPFEEIREALPRLAVVLAIVGVATAFAFGVGPAIALPMGLFVGYVLVEILHARMHIRAPRTRSEEWMWRFHWHHHAADARVNHGLTNPLFDFVFGTAFVPDEVIVPERLAPPWLVEAGSIGGLRVASAAGARRSRPERR